MSNKRKRNLRKNNNNYQKLIDSVLSRRNLTLSIIVAVTVILSFVIELPKKISESLQVFPTPTKLDFLPASENETLIVVADFDDRAKNGSIGVDPAQYIFEQLQSQIKKDNLPVQVKRLYQTVNENTVQDLGATYKAALVVWGWFDTLSINPHIEKINPLQGYVPQSDNNRLELTAPSKIDLGQIDELSKQVTNITLLTLSLDRYWAGDGNSSLAYLNNIISNTTPQTSNQEILTWAYFYRGNSYFFFKQDATKAIQDYSIVIDKSPKMVMALDNRGSLYYETGQYELAIADFDQVIQIEPNNAIAWGTRGAVYAEKGDFDSAISNYNQALQLDSKDALTYENRGIAYSNKSQFDKAISDYTMAINLLPDYASPYYHRGNSYSDLGKVDEAISDFEKAIQLKPDYFEAYFNLGSIYFSIKHDNDKALVYFQQALKYNPNDSDTNHAIGLILIRKNQIVPALKYLDNAILLAPQNAEPYYTRGLVYELLGDKEKAQQDFRKVLELTNDVELIQKAETELKNLSQK